jgi:hypothetical protein
MNRLLWVALAGQLALLTALAYASSVLGVVGGKALPVATLLVAGLACVSAYSLGLGSRKSAAAPPSQDA